MKLLIYMFFFKILLSKTDSKETQTLNLCYALNPSKNMNISVYLKDFCLNYIKFDSFKKKKTDFEKNEFEKADLMLNEICLKINIDEKTEIQCKNINKTTYSLKERTDRMVNNENNQINFKAAVETIKSILYFMFPFKNPPKKLTVNNSVAGYIDGCLAFKNIESFDEKNPESTIEIVDGGVQWMNYLNTRKVFIIEQKFIDSNYQIETNFETKPCDINASFVVSSGNNFTADFVLRNFFGFKSFKAIISITHKLITENTTDKSNTNLAKDGSLYKVILTIQNGQISNDQPENKLVLYVSGQYEFIVPLENFDYKNNEHNGFILISSDIELPGQRFDLKI